MRKVDFWRFFCDFTFLLNLSLLKTMTFILSMSIDDDTPSVLGDVAAEFEDEEEDDALEAEPIDVMRPPGPTEFGVVTQYASGSRQPGAAPS